MSENAYRLSIGDLKCIIFNDGYLQDPDVRFGLNCIYIEAGGRKILVDNGCGASFKGPPGRPETSSADSGTAGHLVKNMAAEGVNPADITDIIFTHAHIDHVCGTCDVNGKTVFPNARYIIHKKEWDYILAGPDGNENLTWLFADARKNLPALKDRFVIVGDNYTVVPGIKLIPAPGHTPGNIMVEITSDGKTLLCIGDIIHAHLEFTEPEHYAALDLNPKQAVQTRKKILTKAVKDQTFLFAVHFAFPGLGRIREKNGVLSWEPI
jgi:glyoxylase-like metal-dependent hydrolase (beta-lactamase superfamily II)